MVFFIFPVSSNLKGAPKLTFVLENGANLILGDWLEAEGEKLRAELGE